MVFLSVANGRIFLYKVEGMVDAPCMAIRDERSIFTWHFVI